MIDLYSVFAFVIGAMASAIFFILRYNSKVSAMKSAKIQSEVLLQGSVKEVEELKKKQIQLENAIRDFDAVRQENARLKATLDKDAELKGAMETQKKLMEAEFRRLASTIMEDSSKMFVNSNKNEMDKLFIPLNEKLTEFKDVINKTYNNESKERFSLKEQIEKLILSSRQMSDDTRKLTEALKGKAKIQGDWGEHILETMLENSGLTKGREFDTQETLRDASGKVVTGDDDKRLRPDVIVHYPDNTDIVIDAKTSLTAYMRYMEAETDEARNKAVEEHLASVSKHVSELATKKYQDYVKSMDFVMMFIPNDYAFMLAMQANPSLWMDAYEKRVMIVSPTHLISVLKMVAVLWRREEQNNNIMRISKAAGDVYVKLVSFCESMEKVGKALDSAHSNYDEAVKRLSTGRDNAIRKLEQMKAMGVDVKGKKIPQVFAEGNEEDNLIEQN